MALTKEEREKWLAVLDRTGGRKKRDVKAV